MKNSKYLYINLLIATATLLFQLAFIITLYNNYALEYEKNVESDIYTSISRLESIDPKGNYNRYPRAPIAIDDMSVKMRDRLLAIVSLPLPPPKFDVEDLIQKDIIRSSEEIGRQYDRDLNYERGERFNLMRLDSIFTIYSIVVSDCTFSLTDNVEERTIFSNSTPITKYTSSSKPFYLGIKARETLMLYYNIPILPFFVEALTLIIASFILLIVVITLIAIQLNLYLKNKELLISMQENINGVVHDLKSPLSSVVMALDLASSKVEDKNIKAILSHTKSSTNHLITSINSLLSAARKENAIHIEQVTQAQLLQMIDSTIIELSNIYPNKQNSIEVENSLGGLKSLFVDKFHFGNIVGNLLDNSLKYSDDDVTIILKVENLSEEVAFSVVDTGWGIEKKYHKKIFKYMFRVPQDGRSTRGYGVGLAQVKQLVAKHGGSVTLYSTPNVGTQITFTIPKL